MMHAEDKGKYLGHITQLLDMRQYSGVIYVNGSPVMCPPSIFTNDADQRARYPMDITQGGSYALTSSRGGSSLLNSREADLKHIYDKPLVELMTDM